MHIYYIYIYISALLILYIYIYIILLFITVIFLRQKAATFSKSISDGDDAETKDKLEGYIDAKLDPVKYFAKMLKADPNLWLKEHLIDFSEDNLVAILNGNTKIATKLKPL